MSYHVPRGRSKMSSHQGKDKGPVIEPVVLEDAVADAEGKPLPRVFVPRVSLPGDGLNADGADTPSQVDKND